MGNVIRILLTTVAAVAFLAGPVRTAPGQIAAAQTITDYNDLAVIVSEPVFDGASFKKARDAYTDGGAMWLKEYQRQRLDRLRRLDPSIQAARENIDQALSKCNFSYKEIRRLDSKTPDFEGIVRQAIDAAPALVKKPKERNTDDKQAINDLATKVIMEAGSAIVNSYNLSVERGNYGKCYHSSRSTTEKAMTPLVQRRYAASAKRPSNQAITIRWVNPSFANTYINDVISLRNDSGQDLSACTLQVILRGPSATEPAGSPKYEWDRHFHYVTHWPAGEYRYLWYPSRGFSGLATNQSVDVLRMINIDLYSDQFATHAAFGLERYDTCLKEWADEYLKPSSFTGRWYTNKENLIDPAGFEVTYKGKTAFTVAKVTVEAVQGNRRVRIYNTQTVWRSGQRIWICHRNFNSINPSDIYVIITFPGATYEHVVSWRR